MYELNPFRELSRLQRQLDRMFDDWTGPSLTTRSEPRLLGGAVFTPTADIAETDSHYLVSIDLPGLKKEDIKVELRGEQLVISGERREEHEQKSKSKYQYERSYGSFARAFSLPGVYKTDQIEASYSDGVLRIAVPKAEAAQSKQIQITEAKPGFWDKLLGHKKEEGKTSSRPAEKVA